MLGEQIVSDHMKVDLGLQLGEWTNPEIDEIFEVSLLGISALVQSPYSLLYQFLVCNRNKDFRCGSRKPLSAFYSLQFAILVASSMVNTKGDKDIININIYPQSIYTVIKKSPKEVCTLVPKCRQFLNILHCLFKLVLFP